MKPGLDNILLKVQDTVTRTVNYTVFLCKGKNFSALKQISRRIPQENQSL